FEYTKVQPRHFFNNVDYVLVFIGDSGTTAKFFGCYKITHQSKAIDEKLFSKDWPSEFIDYLKNSNHVYHELNKTDLFKDMEKRLFIEWGKGTVNWHQNGKNEKPIIKISDAPKFRFAGYENIILKFNQLKRILEDPIL